MLRPMDSELAADRENLDLGRPLRRLLDPPDLIFFVLFLAAFLFLFRGFFFGGGVIFERDGAVLEIPTRALASDLLREGNFALWTDAHGNGQPFLANPKNAVCYPTTWLYLVLPFFTAFRWHYLIHALIGWVGLYGLLKFFRLCRPSALLGASLFSLSGIYLSNFEFYNHIAAFAWTPWILLLSFSDSIRGFKKTAALALLWAFQLLAGTPEAVVITLVLVLVQSLFLPGKPFRRTMTVLLALALGGLISAVQYLPSLETLSRTERATAETSLWPLELIQLANVPFPDVMGSDRGVAAGDYWSGHLFDKGAPLYYSFYLGGAGFLLFLFGLAFKTGRSGRGWRWLFLIFFLMASGRYFPLNEILVRIPFLSSIRYPVKYMMGAMFVVAVVAAGFFDDYFVRKKIAFNRIKTGWLAGIIGCAGLAVLVPALARMLSGIFVIREERLVSALKGSFYAGLAVLSAALVLMGLFGLAKKKAGVLVPLFLLLALLDPLTRNQTINPVVPESFFDPPALLSETGRPAAVYRQEVLPDDLRIRLGDGQKAQTFVRQSLFPFSAMNQGVRYVFNRDFYGLYPKGLRDLRKAAAGWPEDLLLKYLRSIGCEYLIGPNPLGGLPFEERTIEGFPIAVQKIGEDRAFPYFVGKTIAAVTPAEKWTVFSSPDFDPETTAIVDETVPGLSGSAVPAAGIAVAVSETQGRSVFRMKTHTPSLAVFSGNWDPGWKAKIDGKSSPVIGVNLGLKGVVLPAGDHEVEIRYLPGSFLLGAATSGLTILGLLAAGLIFRNRPAKPGQPVESPGRI